MKQYKCSMSKKRESLAKKNEANSEEYITEWQADIIKGLEKVKDKYGLVIEYNGPFSDEWKEYPTYSVFVRKGGKKEDVGTVGTDYVHAFVDYTSPSMNVSSPHYAKDYSAEEAIQVILDSAKMCLGKKGESNNHTCSMSKKIESIAKKTEAAGDSPKKIYRIKSLSTDVVEDDWEHGEGEHVNYWSGSDVLGRKMYQEFSSLGDILRMLNDKYLYIWKDADNINNWAIFDDPDLKDEIRFDCDTTVDVNNSPADASDIESWKKGKKKLFNAHSILFVTAEYTTYASADELTEDAKKIGLETI